MATILAHELSHYLFDIRDEYNNGSVCLGDIATEACMMEGYGWGNYTRWTDAAGNNYPSFDAFFPDYVAGTAVLHDGQPSEYCHDGNHDAAANHNQNNVNGGQSCWTYMSDDANHDDIPYGLVAPAAAGPTAAMPAAPAAVAVTELIPVQRFMLVLDRSGSMMGVKIDQLRVGANFWVDYVNAGEEFGVVTYAATETVDVGMTEVPNAEPAQTDWRTARHTTVDNITAGGTTAIGDALRAGLVEITGAGRASSQVMILFTDGLQNAGAETAEEVLPDLLAGGVRVYTIGLGNDQDAALLANIAETTGARYFPIDGDLPADEAAVAITEALVELAGDSRENGGIVSFDAVDGAPPSSTAPPFDWSFEPREKPPRGDGRSLRFKVPITPGSRQCTLGALWKDPKGKFVVSISDPDGAQIAPGPLVRRIAGKYPYGFYVVDDPKAGVWTVEVAGAGLGKTRFRTLGFEVNPGVSLDVSLVQPHVRLGQEIEVRARLRAPFATPGARISAWVLSAAGKWSRVKFTEHTRGRRDRNEPYTYTARIPTKGEQPGQYLIVVDAVRAKGSFVVVADELYRKRPGIKPQDSKRRVDVPAIVRRKVVGVTVDREGPSGKPPRRGWSPKPPIIPRKQASLVAAWKRKHPTRSTPRFVPVGRAVKQTRARPRGRGRPR